MASEGDIRVLVVLDLLLSLLFASVVLWGLDFIGEVTFTARNLAVGTLALAVVTYLVVLRGYWIQIVHITPAAPRGRSPPRARAFRWRGCEP